MSGARRYMVKLNELSSFAGRRVNLIGRVVEFSVPRITRGTDYCTILKIIDQYQQSPEVAVCVFMRNIDQLPHFVGRRDIILLCSFKVALFEQKYSAVYDHMASSFALFDGEITNDFTPYQVSPTFHSVHSDDEYVRRLRNWSHNTPFDAGISTYAASLKDMMRLKHIDRRDFFDLVCMVIHDIIVSFTFHFLVKGCYFLGLLTVWKVLHVCEVSNGKWMIFVWDGTDAPALDLEKELRVEDFPLQVEQTGLPPSVLCHFPRVGTVLRVMADESYVNFGNHFKIERDWVGFRNLHFRTVSGLWKGVLAPRTKIRHLSKDDDSVQRHISEYVGRVEQHGYLPSCITSSSNFLTAVPNFEDVCCTSLMELLTSSLVCGIFKCVVRFLAVLPSDAKDFKSPEGEYRMRFTLEDPTARIHAFLQNEDADEFFEQQEGIDTLAINMNKLLGVSESASRNPPWTVCCIGFHSSDESDIWGTRHFHVCKTVLDNE